MYSLRSLISIIFGRKAKDDHLNRKYAVGRADTLRSSREDVDASFFSFIGSFCNAYFCWLVVQWIIQIDKIGGYLLRCFIALAGCIAVSLFVFYIKQEFGSVHNKAPVFKLGVRAMSYLLVTRGMVIGGFLFFIAYLLRISELSQRSRIENEYIILPKYWTTA
jgi:hypothetical protein